jgi:hypothetical protein
MDQLKYGYFEYNGLILFAGVTLTLSTLVDAKNFNKGSHSVGLGLELEA